MEPARLCPHRTMCGYRKVLRKPNKPSLCYVFVAISFWHFHILAEQRTRQTGHVYSSESQWFHSHETNKWHKGSFQLCRWMAEQGKREIQNAFSTVLPLWLFFIHFCLEARSCIIKLKRTLIVEMLSVSGLKTTLLEWGWIKSLMSFSFTF